MSIPSFWDSKFDALATYNAEVARGIVHTEDYARRMMALQAEYDARMRAQTGRFDVVVL